MQPWDRSPQHTTLKPVAALDLSYVLRFPAISNPWTRDGGEVPVVTYVRQAANRPRPALRTVGSYPLGDDAVPNNWLEVMGVRRCVIRQVRALAAAAEANASVVRTREQWPKGLAASELGVRLGDLSLRFEESSPKHVVLRNTGRVFATFPDDLCWQRGFRGPNEALHEFILVRLWDMCAAEDIAMAPAPELSDGNPFAGAPWRREPVELHLSR